MLAANVGCLRPGLLLPQETHDLFFFETVRLYRPSPSEVIDVSQPRVIGWQMETELLGRETY
jgi:hypothetical protein